MPKKSQCEIHSEEIKKVRERSHKNANEISKLKLMHEENLKDIEVIKKDINVIKNNHLSHMEKDISSMQTDIGWMKKFFWIVATASIGGLITGLLQLLIN